jgi:putative transposase
VRELILRLTRENIGWGVRRIVGELKKLALRPSRSSVRRLLVDEKILPEPDRHAPEGVQKPWRKFIAVHMNVMVACDFFCKTVWTPLLRLYDPLSPCDF